MGLEYYAKIHIKNEKAMIQTFMEYNGLLFHLLRLMLEKDKRAYEIYYELYKESGFFEPKILIPPSSETYGKLRPTFHWTHGEFLFFFEVPETGVCLWQHMCLTFNETYSELFNIPDFLVKGVKTMN